eukprot:6211698-Karenia_brevis.AAC.1
MCGTWKSMLESGFSRTMGTPKERNSRMKEIVNLHVRFPKSRDLTLCSGLHAIDHVVQGVPNHAPIIRPSLVHDRKNLCTSGLSKLKCAPRAVSKPIAA